MNAIGTLLRDLMGEEGLWLRRRKKKGDTARHRSPGEERGNTTGKVAIVHRSVEPGKRHQLLA